MLDIETPNTKQNIMFPEEALLSLPSWVNSVDVAIHLEPFKERLEEIETFVRKELQKQGCEYP